MDVITSKDDFQLVRGDFYLQRNDFKKAIKSYKNGLKINPENLVILYEIGLAYSKLRRSKKALKYWGKITRIAPQSYLGDKVKLHGLTPMASAVSVFPSSGTLHRRPFIHALTGVAFWCMGKRRKQPDKSKTAVAQTSGK